MDNGTVQLSGSKAVNGFLGKSTNVEVQLRYDNTQDQTFTPRSVPLRGEQTAELFQGKGELGVDGIGNWSLDLLQNGKLVCPIVPRMSFNKCKPGFTKVGNQCLEPSCGSVSAEQSEGTGSDNSVLKVNVHNTGYLPQLFLSRKDSVHKLKLAADGKGWSTKERAVPPGEWEVLYVSKGGQVCDSTALIPVVCSDGHEERGGRCTRKSRCGNLKVEQTNANGAENSKLTVNVTDTDGMSSSQPTLLLSRKTDTQNLSSTFGSQGIWSATVGEWEVQWEVDGQACPTKVLRPISCEDGFEERGGGCEKKREDQDKCGEVKMRQQDTIKAKNANLVIEVTGATVKPKLTLSPVIEKYNVSSEVVSDLH